jgi:F-type H+-transporting ATPase subunit b
VLADRYGRTGGAMDEARTAISAAESKTAEYEARIRAARAELFEARAARQKAASDAREHLLAETREAAGKRIAAARENVERTGSEARAQIETGAASLSQGVLAAILPHRAGTQTGAAQ